MISRLFSSICFAAALVHIVSADPIFARQQEGGEEQAFSTFVHKTGKGNLTFSLNAATSTGDVFFHLSAPATYQWVAIGTGQKMDGSVMWVVYKSSVKNELTLSSRLSTDQIEPSYSSSIPCSSVLSSSSTSQNGIIKINNKNYYSLNVQCTNITSLGRGDGRLDLSNPKQAFMYAFGPSGKSVSSKSRTAGIRRHDSYGTFWMDMAKATSESGSVPDGEALTTTTNAGADGGATSDGDNFGHAHAALMLGTFVVLFPLGAVLLRFLESVKIHWIVQLVGMVMAVIGVGVGLYLGRMYNHTKDMSSGHQIFGLAVVLFVLVQFGTGAWHHLQYCKYKSPTHFGTFHRFAGPAVVIGGVIDGFTGFSLSDESGRNVYYGIAVAVITVIVVGLLAWKRWSKPEARRVNGAVISEDGIGLNAVPTEYNRA